VIKRRRNPFNADPGVKGDYSPLIVSQ